MSIDVAKDFALHSSNGNRALALDESNHRSNGVLGRDGDTHMRVIRHQMTFKDPAFFLLRAYTQTYLNTIYSDAWVEEHFGDVSRLWLQTEGVETCLSAV